MLNIHLECFPMRKDLSFNKKEKVSSFILPEILKKNAGINKITPSKFIHYLRVLENALTIFCSNFTCKLSILGSLNP